MKTFYITVLLAVALISISTRAAQSNAPVRLAVLVEDASAQDAGDLLTAELSKRQDLQLFDRTELDKAYREQALSAASKDYLKIGQVLGANGLLLLETITDTNRARIALPAGFGGPEAHPFRVQLIATGPGVVLMNERFQVMDVSEWAGGFADHLGPLLPKLSVPAKDAVAISIVNLRSAVQSKETRELERQITALALERLSREERLFVLDRQNMQLLAEEKGLKGVDDSAFWNGSYLLDGILDREGYSKDTVTLSARLTPPKGGAALDIEVSGSRTNLADVVNEFAAKVLERLKLGAGAAPWNPTEEAQQYFEEAKWALRWNILREAQTASESAWALGKQDAECAVLRLHAYLGDIPQVKPPGVEYGNVNENKRPNYVHINQMPDPKNASRALHVLELYGAFSHDSTNADIRIVSRGRGWNDWHNSETYQLGLDALTAASGVLEHFNAHPESQPPVADSLAEVRAMARSIAKQISESPSVHDNYFTGDRMVSQDELYQTVGGSNIFRCEINDGCFWQERPEEALALYRGLMDNPLFVCLQYDLWFREGSKPRLAAWTPEDRARLPKVWQDFIADLSRSTNAFLAMEARAMQLADAKTEVDNADPDAIRLRVGGAAYESFKAQREQNLGTTWTNLFDYIFANYDSIVTGREQLLDLDWGFGGIFSSSGVVTPMKEKLADQIRHEYGAKLGSLADDHRRRKSERLKEIGNKEAFEKQKKFLADFAPYDFFKFNDTFSTRDYSKSQAAELKPLVEAYRSNLVAQASHGTVLDKFHAQSDAGRIEFYLQQSLDKALNPPPAAEPPKIAAAAPAPPPRNIAPPNAPVRHFAPDTSALAAKFILTIPTNELPVSVSVTNIAGMTILGHHVDDGALLLDLRYRDRHWTPWTNGSSSQITVYREAAAIWHPDRGWEIIPYPHTEDSIMGAGDFMAGSMGISSAGPVQDSGQNSFFELFDGALYVSDRDALRRYDIETRRWEELPGAGQNRLRLYAVGGHLYAASSESIEEILDNGRSARILAGIRRRPAVSILDSRDSLGAPRLFAGPGGSLCAELGDGVFSWTGSDWMPNNGVVNMSTAYFHSAEYQRWSQSRPRAAGMNPAAPNHPAGFFRGMEPPHIFDGSDIYFLERESEEPRLGFATVDSPTPLVMPLQFQQAAPETNARPVMVQNYWMDGSSDFLFIGRSGRNGIWVFAKADIKTEVHRRTKQSSAAANPAGAAPAHSP